MNKFYSKIAGLVLLFISFMSLPLYSQNIGIGTLSPNTSAALDISNTAKGLLIPRMISTGITAIPSPAKGLMVYDSVKNQLMINMGTAQIPNWQNIVSGSGWGLQGNSGTGNGFIGTTDGSPLIFKVSNIMAGYIDSAAKTAATSFGFRALNSNTTGPLNAAFGYQALSSNTSGAYNAAIGYRALYSNTTGDFNTAIGIASLQSNVFASNNTAIGEGALNQNTANQNTAIGSSALQSNTSGTDNTATGYVALFDNTTGKQNTAYGASAMYASTSGDDNTVVGYEALEFNTGGNNNVAIGANTMSNNKSGSSNTAIGIYALYENSTGTYNTASGASALANNTSGNFNSASGDQALERNQTGSYNTADGLNALYNNSGDLASFNTGIGFQALFNTTNSEYNTAVGYNAGSGQDNGYNNVFLGANTDVNGAGYYNVIAIGQGTICTGSSQVTIGNGATGSYRAYANWSNISDGRFKKNIQENVPGLDFISQLRPVTYNLNATGLDAFLRTGTISNTVQSAVTNTRTTGKPGEKIAVQPYTDAARTIYNNALKEKEQAIQTGFVAQEVEATAKKLGFNFSGIDAPKDGNDVYGLRYAEFVVPLVKAVQEQQQMITAMNKRIDLLEKQNELLQQLINKKN